MGIDEKRSFVVGKNGRRVKGAVRRTTRRKP
jgi:hypothetical protein